VGERVFCLFRISAQSAASPPKQLPLSEVFRSVRSTGGIFLDAHFTAPWCVFTQVGGEDCEAFLGGPAQIIAYHFIIDGTLLVSVEGAVESLPEQRRPL
jgi:hypothetical protein